MATPKIRSSQKLTDDQVESVMNCLAWLVEDHGGEMDASRLDLLPCLHADALQVIEAAGGLEGFCARSNSRLMIRKVWGMSRIVLNRETDQLPEAEILGQKSTLCDWSVPAANESTSRDHSSIFSGNVDEGLALRTENSVLTSSWRSTTTSIQNANSSSPAGTPAWTCAAKCNRLLSSLRPKETFELAGNVTAFSRQGHAFMESVPGVVDVCVPSSVVSVSPEFAVGDFLHVRAHEHDSGNNKYRVHSIIGVIRQSQQLSMSEKHEEEHHFQGGRDSDVELSQNSTAGAESTRSETTSLRVSSSEISVDLESPHATEKNHTVVNDKVDEEWEEDAESLVEVMVQMLLKLGGKMDGGKLQLLYAEHPQAKKQLKAVGGLKAFCRQHNSLLHFEADGASGLLRLRRHARQGLQQQADAGRHEALVASNRFHVLPHSSASARRNRATDCLQDPAENAEGNQGTKEEPANCTITSLPQTAAGNVQETRRGGLGGMQLEAEQQTAGECSMRAVPASGSDSPFEPTDGACLLWASVRDQWVQGDNAQEQDASAGMLAKVVSRHLTMTPEASGQLSVQTLFSDLKELGIFALCGHASQLMRGRFESKAFPDTSTSAALYGILKQRRVHQFATLLLCAQTALEGVPELKTEQEADLHDQILYALLTCKAVAASFFSQMVSQSTEMNSSLMYLNVISELDRSMKMARDLSSGTRKTMQRSSMLTSLGNLGGTQLSQSHGARFACAVGTLMMTSPCTMVQPAFTHTLADTALEVCATPWCHNAVLSNSSSHLLCSGCGARYPVLSHVRTLMPGISCRPGMEEATRSLEQLQHSWLFILTSAYLHNGHYCSFKTIPPERERSHEKQIVAILRCLQDQDDCTLESLLKPPEVKQISTAAALNKWWALSWVPLFEVFAGVEMVLLSDSSAEDSGRPGKLFRVLFEAVMKLFNRCREAQIDLDRPKAFLAAFVRRVASVSELCSPGRVKLAITTARTAKRVPGLFTYSLRRPSPCDSTRGDLRTLQAALDSCRPTLVAEILAWGLDISACKEEGQTLPLLHRVCALAPPTVTSSFKLAPPKGAHDEKQFEEQFTLQGFKFMAVLFPTVRADDLASRKLLLCCQDTPQLGALGQLLTDVTLHASNPEKTIKARVMFSSRHAVSSFIIPATSQDSSADFEIKIDVCFVAIANSGTRSIRSAGVWREDQAKIISLLLEHNAGLDVRNKSGQLAWNVAVQSGVPEAIRALVMPQNVELALTAASNSQNMHEDEIYPLVDALPKKQMLHLNLECFLGRGWLQSPSSLELLFAKLLKHTFVSSSLFDAAQASLRHSAWGVLQQLLEQISKRCLELPCLFAVHDAVSAGQNSLLIRLLDLKASPDVHHQQQGTGAETPLHVACRVGNAEAVSILISRGCKLSCTETLHGDTPLHVACESLGAEASCIVNLLLKAGADHEAKNKQKRQPAMLAKQKDVKRLLREFVAQKKGSFAGFPQKLRDAQSENSSLSCNANPVVPKLKDPASFQASRDQVQRAVQSSNSVSTEPRPSRETRIVTLDERIVAARNKIEELRILHDGTETDAPAEQHPDAAASNLNSSHAPAKAANDAVQRPSTAGLPPPESHSKLQTPALGITNVSVREGNGTDIVEPEEQGHAQGACNLEDAKVTLSSGLAWDLRCTREFKEQLFSEEMRSNRQLMQAMLRNIRRLASGEQGRGLMKLLKGTPKSLRLFESPCKTFNDGGRFLWQFAVDYSPRVGVFSETIRLWTLCLQHDQVPKAIENIVLAHKRGQTSTVKRALKPTCGSTLHNGMRMPCTYQVQDGIDPQQLMAHQTRFEQLVDDNVESARDNADLVVYTPPAIAAANSYNVLKFYALNSRVLDLVSSLTSGINVAAGTASPEFPFIPDQKEDAIITGSTGANFSSSTLLIGRSGTGKTSIALGRLWKQYELWHSTFNNASISSSDGTPEFEYHQVFITANKVLRDQVRKSFEGMRSGLLGYDTSQQRAEYPATLNNVLQEMFPLFLSQLEWLTMLDGTLDKPFFPRNADGSLIEGVQSCFHEEEGMLESLPLDAEDWRSHSSDEDGEEWDIKAGDGPVGTASWASDSADQKEHKVEIDSRRFHEDVWPQIVKKMKKDTCGISPSTLFAEIHSYIKGSHLALDRPAGFLSREEYLRLPVKMAPNFRGLGHSDSLEDLPANKTGNRDIVYDMFEVYEKLKRQMRAYDNSDLIHHVWTGLQRKGYTGTPIDSVFVDEAQDFTQAELRLFIRTCRDKNDMFFSGDTCQTIASGVGFRFEDLRTLFKTEQDLQLEPCVRKIAVPDISVLSVNYRTHNGILAAAAGIVDLLESFFPSTIDVLDRERGFFDGPKPIVLSETSMDDAALLIVGSDKKTSQIEFGANQVILVRTQESKNTLPREFDSCLAMTILESKGLEFDDVFLFNFLKESRAENEWRIVLSFLAQNDASVEVDLAQKRSETKDSRVAGMLRTLEFSKDAHLILGEELKQLYTAVTRARVRVIIYEEDEAKRAPLFYYLQRRQLVDVLSYFEEQQHAPLTTQTSPEEWRARGLNLRENGMLALAAKCFARAGDERLENETLGQNLATKAVKETNKERRCDTFFAAAEHFLAAGRTATLSAARCFAEANQLALSAELFLLSSGPKSLQWAVQCYCRMGKIERGVELLLGRNKVRKALELLRKHQKPHRALDVLKENPDFDPPPQLSKASFAEEAIAQLPTGDASSEKFLELTRLLPPKEELKHLEKRGFKEQLLKRFQELGEVVSAAKVLQRDNRLCDAAKLLESAPSNDIAALSTSTEVYLLMYLDSAFQTKRSCWFEKAIASSKKLLSVLKGENNETARKDAVAIQNRQLMIHLHSAGTSQNPLDRLQHVQSIVPAPLTSEQPLLHAWIRGDALRSTSKPQSVCNSKTAGWLMEVPEVLENFEKVLAVLNAVQNRNGKTMQGTSELYLRCEQLFGLHRQQNGASMIRHADKALMLSLLRAADLPQDATRVLHGDGEVEYFDAQKHFQPALSKFLSGKRQQLLEFVAEEIARNPPQPQTVQPREDPWLRHICLQLWISDLQVMVRPKGEVDATAEHNLLDWSRKKKEDSAEQLVALLITRVSTGSKFDLKTIGEIPRGVASVARRELLACSRKILAGWKASRTSAEVLSVALCIERSLMSAEICLQSLSKLASEDKDACHPPMLQTFIRELHTAKRALKDKPIASISAHVRYISAHIMREPPIDMWPAIELALAEASIVLFSPVGAHGKKSLPGITSGRDGLALVDFESMSAIRSPDMFGLWVPALPRTTKTLLPNSVADRIRKKRGSEQVDASHLLLVAFETAVVALNRQFNSSLHEVVCVDVRRATSTVLTCLLNFALGRTHTDSGWARVPSKKLENLVLKLPVDFLEELKSTTETGLSHCVFESGAVHVPSPDTLKAGLAAQGDKLVFLLNVPTSKADKHWHLQSKYSISDKDLAEAQRVFVSLARSSAPASATKQSTMQNAWFSGKPAQNPWFAASHDIATDAIDAHFGPSGSGSIQSVVFSSAEGRRESISAGLEEVPGLVRETSSGFQTEEASEEQYLVAVDLIVRVLRRKLDMQMHQRRVKEQREAVESQEIVTWQGQLSNIELQMTDPFQQRMRYAFWSECAEEGSFGVHMAITNGRRTVFDSSNSDYQALKSWLLSFQDAYSSRVAPVLVQADNLSLELQELWKQGDLLPHHKLSIQGALTDISSSSSQIQAVLNDVDEHCAWKEALDSDVSNLFALTNNVVENLLPKVNSFVQNLKVLDPSELFLAASPAFPPQINLSGDPDAPSQLPGAPGNPLGGRIPGLWTPAADSGATALPQPQHGHVNHVSAFASFGHTKHEDFRLVSPRVETMIKPELKPLDSRDLVPGRKCRATFYPNGSLRPAKLVSRTKDMKQPRSWLVHFEDCDPPEPQATATKDLFPIAAWDHATQTRRGTMPKGGDFDPDLDDGEEPSLGWQQQQTQQARRQCRRFGRRAPRNSPTKPPSAAAGGPRQPLTAASTSGGARTTSMGSGKGGNGRGRRGHGAATGRKAGSTPP